MICFCAFAILHALAQFCLLSFAFNCFCLILLAFHCLRLLFIASACLGHLFTSLFDFVTFYILFFLISVVLNSCLLAF